MKTKQKKKKYKKSSKGKEICLFKKHQFCLDFAVSRSPLKPINLLRKSYVGVCFGDVSIGGNKSGILIVKASSEIPYGDDDPQSESDDDEDFPVGDELPLDAKLQNKLEKKLKMKIAKKIRLRRKKLVHKRRLRKKGRWPPSKM